MAAGPLGWLAILSIQFFLHFYCTTSRCHESMPNLLKKCGHEKKGLRPSYPVAFILRKYLSIKATTGYSICASSTLRGLRGIRFACSARTLLLRIGFCVHLRDCGLCLLLRCRYRRLCRRHSRLRLLLPPLPSKEGETSEKVLPRTDRPADQMLFSICLFISSSRAASVMSNQFRIESSSAARMSDAGSAPRTTSARAAATAGVGLRAADATDPM